MSCFVKKTRRLPLLPLSPLTRRPHCLVFGLRPFVGGGVGGAFQRPFSSKNSPHKRPRKPSSSGTELEAPSRHTPQSTPPSANNHTPQRHHHQKHKQKQHNHQPQHQTQQQQQQQHHYHPQQKKQDQAESSQLVQLASHAKWAALFSQLEALPSSPSIPVMAALLQHCVAGQAGPEEVDKLLLICEQRFNMLPTSPMIFDLVKFYIRAHKEQTALRLLQTTERLPANIAEACYRFALNELLLSGRLEHAVEMLQGLLRVSPLNTQDLVTCGMMFNKHSSAPHTDINHLLDLIVAAVEAGYHCPSWLVEKIAVRLQKEHDKTNALKLLQLLFANKLPSSSQACSALLQLDDSLPSLLQTYFHQNDNRDIKSYNMLLEMVIQNGLFEQAFAIYDDLKAIGVSPDHSTFELLLSISTQQLDGITGINFERLVHPVFSRSFVFLFCLFFRFLFFVVVGNGCN
ncbi:Rxt3-domain-containing protein [Balamuthia mandrillaris]